MGGCGWSGLVWLNARVSSLLAAWFGLASRDSLSRDETLTVLLEDTEDLDDDLGRGADEHLALSTALSVDCGLAPVLLSCCCARSLPFAVSIVPPAFSPPLCPPIPQKRPRAATKNAPIDWRASARTETRTILIRLRSACPPNDVLQLRLLTFGGWGGVQRRTRNE